MSKTGPTNDRSAAEDFEATALETLIEASESLDTEADESADWHDLELGRYQLLRTLGRGGMGLVFLARQTEPVEREVALKLIRRRVLNPSNLARFEVERQALAQMQHPAIAQVFDAGTTAEGYPYFAMEFIHGQPLHVYCREHRLSLPERLDLFVRICQGVQHAHQKGIIHRDLKPANILVTRIDGVAVPKIIDFGIATTADRATDRAADSQPSEHIGTPEYMSPEQFGSRPDAIDTRSDVYSLGVILHQLLIEETPLKRDQLSQTRDPAELARAFHALTEQPSRRLDRTTIRAIAEQRCTSPRRLRRALKPDLDAVVMKALAPDPDQRYASAGDLAADIQRSRRHEPVLALPASVPYRARKFMRRHALALGSASAVLLALIAGLAAATISLFEAQRQFRLAEQRQIELEQVTRFQQDMLEGISPREMGEGMFEEIERQLRSGLDRAGAEPDQADATLTPLSAQVSPTDLARHALDRFILARAAVSVEEQFAGQPQVQADLYRSLHDVYRAIDQPSALPELAANIVALRRQQHGPQALETLRARSRMGFSLYLANRLDEARAELEAVRGLLDTEDTEHRELLINTSNRLGTVLVDQGAMSEAIEIMTQTAHQARDWFGPEHDLSIRSASSLGFVHARSRNFEQGLVYFEQALDALRETLPPDNPRIGRAMLNVASSYGQLARYEEALEMDRDIVAFFTATDGRRSSNTLRAMSNKANNLASLNRPEDARDLLLEDTELATEALGAEHPITLRIRVNLGSLLSRTGDPEAARPLLEDVVLIREQNLGPDHQETLSAQEILASILLDLDEPQAAHDLISCVLERRQAVFGPDHPQTAVAMQILAVSLIDGGRPEDALEPARQAAGFFAERTGANSGPALRSALAWYRAELASGNPGQAATILETRLQALVSDDPDPGHSRLIAELVAAQKNALPDSD